MIKEFSSVNDAAKSILIPHFNCPVINRRIEMGLDKNKIATVELSTNGVQGNYVGLHACIINKDTGKVASRFFPFQEFLEPANELPPALKERNLKPYIWEMRSNSSIEWYGSVPTEDSLMTILEAVDNWFSLYKKA